MEFRELGTTGIKLSKVSLGGASFSNIYGDFDEAESVQLIKDAFKLGVNYIETGPWYGQGSSERTVGKALQGIPRQSYYIGSKVGRYEKITEKMFDFSAEKTEASVDNTLRLLGLDYVDIIQIHDLSFALDPTVVLKETLPALERAVGDGKARYIGLADYDIDLMREVVEESEVKISSILSYAKSTLYDNRLQTNTAFFKNKGVGVINAAATGMGLLTNKGPQPWHPASDHVKEICRQAAKFCEEQDIELARLATWFALSQPDIATHVCGLFSLQQLEDTLALMRSGLCERELAALKEVQSRFFHTTPLHWDGVEFEKYKKKVARHGSHSD